MELVDHPATLEILVNQVPRDFLELPVILVKKENPDLLAYQAIQVKMVKMATLADPVQLVQLDQLETLVNPDHQDLPDRKD